jgi:hypothetical protein
MKETGKITNLVNTRCPQALLESECRITCAISISLARLAAGKSLPIFIPRLLNNTLQTTRHFCGQNVLAFLLHLVFLPAHGQRTDAQPCASLACDTRTGRHMILACPGC